MIGRLEGARLGIAQGDPAQTRRALAAQQLTPQEDSWCPHSLRYAWRGSERQHRASLARSLPGPKSGPASRRFLGQPLPTLVGAVPKTRNLLELGAGGTTESNYIKKKKPLWRLRPDF